MTILEPSTWHVLGLSVAVSYIGLGILTYALPQTSGKILFDIPDTATGLSNKKTDEPHLSPDIAAVTLALPLLGARDLTIATALFVFSWEGKTREMGTLILAGTILCVADVITVWQRKGAGL